MINIERFVEEKRQHMSPIRSCLAKVLPQVTHPTHLKTSETQDNKYREENERRVRRYVNSHLSAWTVVKAPRLLLMIMIGRDSQKGPAISPEGQLLTVGDGHVGRRGMGGGWRETVGGGGRVRDQHSNCW